ncbi:MAG TPA: ATP-dependent metallopeptidase FtsH/Yme1/Tma family protein, partial [Planctomycetaceae bacterium]|nr:ATP-dependent metallopeptidase FtsH/Yme1/Tma family protein [Planctomycetaceae bacterium]
MSNAPWLLLLGFVTLLVLYFSLKSPGNTGTRVSYSFFRQEVDANNVKSVKVYGEILSGKWIKIPPNPPADVGKLTEEFNLVLPPN